MFGSLFHAHAPRRLRRPTRARPPVTRAPAVLEPLEGRQLLSAVAPASLNGQRLAFGKSTLPATAIGGDTIKGAVTVTLTNNAVGAYTGRETFKVYASTDATVDAADVVLGTLAKRVHLKASGSVTATVPVKAQGAPAAAADYFILAQVTDPDGNTSTTVDAPTLAVTARAVALTATVGTVSPAAIKLDRTVSFRVTLTNAGNADSIGKLTATLALSSDGTTVLQTIGTVTRTVTIRNHGKATVLSYRAKVPVAGTFHVGASFTQGSATVATVYSPTLITVASS